MSYRAKCPWCRRVTVPQPTKMRAIKEVERHLKKSDHPKRDKIVVREAVKRSVEEV